MPDPKKTTQSEPKEQPPVLADGAASTDPAVHQLLAHRYTAAMNGDKEAADAATAQLAELGYK